jgi:DNA/RNA-binding domain of Phe-tRNA-synthetase-like protein
MMKIIVSKEIESVCPNFVGAAVEANVKNTAFCPALWQEINALVEQYRQTMDTTSIKEHIPGITATHRVYKACGKDPSRYRPSAEALIRRVLQGKELYQIDTLVDLINLASMRFGYSIGGFDADKFVGDTLTLGIGQKEEPYEGIGRGLINIDGMPVYRDAAGGVGTPTSDHERTKITLETTHLLTLVNGYDGNEAQVRANAAFIQQLLRQYCDSDGGTCVIYK